MTCTTTMPCPDNDPAWHAGFLALLPAIRLRARVAFRGLDPEAREEAMQDVTANAMAAYRRLHEQGRANIAHPTPLARYAIRQFRDGRRVGTKQNVRDVSSPHAQIHNDIYLERLDRFDRHENAWREVLVEDRRAGPAETAASRIDFPAWMRSLPVRLRRIAKLLANGQRSSVVAKRFGVTPGRVSQIRRLLHDAWQRFHGEGPEAVGVAA